MMMFVRDDILGSQIFCSYRGLCRSESVAVGGNYLQQIRNFISWLMLGKGLWETVSCTGGLLSKVIAGRHKIICK